MKSVKPSRLNRDYACPECEGYLAVYGPAENDEWVCLDCNTVYTRERLRERALRLVRMERYMIDDCGEMED